MSNGNSINTTLLESLCAYILSALVGPAVAPSSEVVTLGMGRYIATGHQTDSRIFPTISRG